MFIQASFSVAQAKVTKDRAADAAGFISLAQNLGIALALAISGSIFQNKAVDGLRSVLPMVPVATLRNAVSGANSSLFQTLTPEMGARVLAVIVNAMAYTYVLVITAGALSIVGSLFMSVSHLHPRLVVDTSKADASRLARTTIHASSGRGIKPIRPNEQYPCRGRTFAPVPFGV